MDIGGAGMLALEDGGRGAWPVVCVCVLGECMYACLVWLACVGVQYETGMLVCLDVQGHVLHVTMLCVRTCIMCISAWPAGDC